jgi:hypothetical protein
MIRQDIMAVLKLCGEAVLIAIIAGIAVGIIGNWQKWESSLQYSNAFFIAGCFVIIAGLSTRLGAGQEWSSSQMLGTESFRDMSPGERVNAIINLSGSMRLVVLGLLSGLMLILVSAIEGGLV